jgi:hypothetical protein
MNLDNLINDILEEENVAGGETSALGPNASKSYGDNTAGDTRIPFSVFGKKIQKRSPFDKKSKKRKKR